MIYLDNWAIGFKHCGDPYQPPEVGYQVLQGNVTGHYKFEDGAHIITSELIETEVREGGEQVALTKSGTEYCLREMSEDYRKWLKIRVGDAKCCDCGCPFLLGELMQAFLRSPDDEEGSWTESVVVDANFQNRTAGNRHEMKRRHQDCA